MSGFPMLPSTICLCQKFVLSKVVKNTMNIGVGQVRDALYRFFIAKKCPFVSLADAAISRITPDHHVLCAPNK